jgi:hypothetical protein
MDQKVLEPIYDERVSPLMTQIIAICQEAGMPFLACFQLGPSDGEETLICHTQVLPEGTTHSLKEASAILRKRQHFLLLAISEPK